MSNVAREVIWPTSNDVLVRVVFLYVGQGDSTIVLVKDGDNYKTLLIDVNQDKEGLGGIKVPTLVKDLLEESGGKLDVFVNTHPHNDGFDLTTLTDSSFSGNTAKNNAKAGIFLDANCSGNTLTGNTASANANSGFGGYDLEDLSAGAGTDGTANTWHKNKAGTANPIGLLTA